MATKRGSRGFHRTFLLLSLFLLASGFTAIAQASTQFLTILPGQSWTPGTAPNRYNPTTQVAGEQFSLNVYCYDNVGQGAVTSGFATTTLSSNAGTYTFNPSSSFDLPETVGLVSRARRGGSNVITGVLTPASTGTYTISLASASGIDPDTTSVYVQRVSQFVFTIGSFTAGSAGTLTIQAQDASNNVCTGFTGTAGTVTLYAYEAGLNGATVNLGNITFTNGVYTATPTFYHASPYARFQVVKSNTPAVTSTSSNFTISPASFSRLLILGPGQTLQQGENGGNGRTGLSNTTTAQTAGTAFAMTVYAADAYWNTRTAAGETVTLSSEDPSFASQNQTFGGGASSVSFGSVNLHSVGDGYLTMTASDGTHTNNTDIVRLNPAATLNNFSIAVSSAGSTTTSTAITVVVKGFDVYGNTLTTIPGNSTMNVLLGGTTPINGPSTTLGAWQISPTFSSGNFTSGIFTGTMYIRKAGNNYVVRAANDVAVVPSTDSSPSFNVAAGSYSRYVMIMPGQTFVPGERQSTAVPWGRFGTGSDRTAGVAFNVSVVAVDAYGNRTIRDESLTGWNGTQNLDVADGLAVGSDPIAVVSGSAYPSFTLTVATTTQQMSIPSLPVVNGGTFRVINTALDHFAIQTTTSQVAGNQYNTTIRAEDIYGNLVTSYAGTVYLTCPNLDYTSPTQSVIQVTGGTSNYTSGSTTANWRLTGFSQGALTNVPVRIYRASTVANGYGAAPGPSPLFVSDVANDRPTSHTGHIGQSSDITVIPNSFKSMFVIVPGLQYRSGADASGNTYFAGVGYSGTVLSQQQNTPFGVTVYATDSYWNMITTSVDQFSVTSNPVDSNVHFNIPGQGYASTFNLAAGQLLLETTLPVGNFALTFTNPSPGINPYTTPYTIISFAIDHFNIRQLSGGGPLPTYWTAGVPVNVSITAYSDATTLATTFNGIAALKCTLDHSDTLQVIRPTTITFTNGVWTGPVTLFRADRLPDAQDNNNFTVNFSNVHSSTATIHVVPADPDRLLVVESGGQIAYPGLNPDVLSDYTGSVGQPAIQTAGSAIAKISFFLCDQYWNTVTDTTKGSMDPIIINCSDPYPARIDGVGAFVGGNLTVNLNYGKYDAVNTFKLYTVNGTDGQSIGVTKATGEDPYTLGVQKLRVPVRHALAGGAVSPNAFRFILPSTVISSGATAGVPFPVTIAVLDAYGNTLDSLNGANSFEWDGSKTVALSANTDVGGYSMWPLTVGNTTATAWIEGVSKPWVYVYKKVTGSEFLTASFDFGSGARTGVSHTFSVIPNAFARLVPWVSGMKFPDDTGAGGVYTGSFPSTPPAAIASNFNSFGTPNQQTAGTTFNIRAYSCDIYGNMTQYSYDGVSMTTTDRFAPNAPDSALGGGTGYASFSVFKFHTQKSSTITVYDTTVNTITAGTTPAIPVIHGAFYGMQVLAPGQVAVEGSGNTNVTNTSPVPDGGWYSGVTPAVPSASDPSVYRGYVQVGGVAFGVTVVAVDLYGNFCGSVPGDRIRLTTDALNASSRPTTTNPSYDWLGTTLTGKAWFSCNIANADSGVHRIMPTDMSNGAIKGDPDSFSVVQIANDTQTKFKVFINGIAPEDSQLLYVDALPNTFNVRVEVYYPGAGDYQIVSTAQSFLMEPTLNQEIPPAPGNGQLGVTNGMTTFGIANVPLQSYNRAETIFIRVRNSSGSQYPEAGFSHEIRIRASAPTGVRMWSDATHVQTQSDDYYQIEANKQTRVYAQFTDANGNLVTGVTGDMQIVNTPGTTSTLGAPETLLTDNNGTFYRTFTAGANNLRHTIRATAQGTSGDLIMNVTVTENGGVYPNPFNPLQGQVVHIDYPMEKASSAKVYIYTLLGDLVWHKEFPADSEGGHAGVNSIPWDGKNDNGVTVANGGYICAIKINDQEKFRFKIGVYKEK